MSNEEENLAGIHITAVIGVVSFVFDNRFKAIY